MGEVPAGFRELRGVGPATEARLHDAGVYTWEALHEVVDALAAVRAGTGDPLRVLADQLAERVGPDGGRGPRRDRHGEAFVVRISVEGDGTPERSSATHVGSLDERLWAGWSPDEVIRFVEERAGVSTEGRARRAPDRGRELVLDGGTDVGGGPRTVEVVVAAADVGTADYSYRATLDERRYGSEAAWTAIAATTGRGHAPAELRLRFDQVPVPAGVRRLRLRVAVRERDAASV